jgi:DNA-binding NarL/FixJ family response regulator
VSICVLLADDQPLLRRGFRMIIEAEGDLTVTAEAGNGAEAVELARRNPPDVVLMDIRMPGTDGIEATRRIIAANPDVRVLVLTTFDLDEYAFGALHAGASGFLLKDVHPAELVTAIRTVAAGNAVVSPRVTRRLLEEYAQVPVLSAAQRADRYPQLSSLTERESEVLTAVARGLSNAEIGATLYVSEATVKSHVGRILAKLDLRDRVQVVVLAYEAGIVRPGTLTPPEAPSGPGQPALQKTGQAAGQVRDRASPDWLGPGLAKLRRRHVHREVQRVLAPFVIPVPVRHSFGKADKAPGRRTEHLAVDLDIHLARQHVENLLEVVRVQAFR